MTSEIGRKAILAILKKHGHPIYIGRRDTRFHCSCYDEANGEGGCAQCFGTGFKITIAEAKAYKKRNAQLPMPESRKEGVVGTENRQSFMFVVGPDTLVNKGDVLLEKPSGGYEKHRVRVVYPIYDAGKCVFKEIFTIGEGD